MRYDSELVYLSLDEERLVLRKPRGDRPYIPMYMFDRAELHDWIKGDVITVDSGPMDPYREHQADTNQPPNEEDYLLLNKRTNKTVRVRKNDFACENAFTWLQELIDSKVLP